MPVSVVISTGIGRLHLFQSALAIHDAGIHVVVVTGWVPSRADSLMVRLASFVVRRDLRPGMEKRLMSRAFPVKSCFFAEAVAQIIRQLAHCMSPFLLDCEPLCWRLFGWQSKAYVCASYKIFHCRSGAGQGGAIEKARRLGLKVLIDHSALHPAVSARNLSDEYARWGQEIAIAPDVGVWNVVLEDCREADVIMVNANHIKDSFVDQGYSPEKLRVVYLGVRPDFFSLKKSYKVGETVRILYTGAFSILKGAEYTLESIRTLTDRGLSVQLDVYGSLDAPVAMRKRFDDLRIVYHGSVPQDDLKRVLSSSDIYLFPSLADGCAQSGMEALAAGLPVVATYQSGLPIVDGETGCVVPMKDSRAIADKVEWLCRHDAVRERIGRAAARMIAENYTWEKYSENVKRVYEELVGDVV